MLADLMSVNQYVRRAIIMSQRYYIWKDGDGTEHYFEVNGDGPYSDCEGMQLKLSLTSNWVLIKDKSDTQMRFPLMTGYEKVYLDGIQDAQGNTMFLTYDANYPGRVTKVKDGINRETVLSYGSNGLLSSITAPGCPVVSFTYGGNSTTGYILTRISYSDLSSNQYTEYSYDTYGGQQFTATLVKIKNYDGIETRIGYDTDLAGITVITYTYEKLPEPEKPIDEGGEHCSCSTCCCNASCPNQTNPIDGNQPNINIDININNENNSDNHSENNNDNTVENNSDNHSETTIDDHSDNHVENNVDNTTEVSNDTNVDNHNDNSNEVNNDNSTELNNDNSTNVNNENNNQDENNINIENNPTQTNENQNDNSSSSEANNENQNDNSSSSSSDNENHNDSTITNNPVNTNNNEANPINTIENNPVNTVEVNPVNTIENNPVSTNENNSNHESNPVISNEENSNNENHNENNSTCTENCEKECEGNSCEKEETPAPKKGLVIANYLDEDGKVIAASEITMDEVEKDYITNQKNIPNYVFKKVVGNPTGKYSDEIYTVNYYYEKEEEVLPTKGTVVVYYIDTEGNPLEEKTIIEGEVGEQYLTDLKSFENYTFKTTVGNKNGTIKEGITEVVYIYDTKTSCNEPSCTPTCPDDSCEKEKMGVVVARYIDQNGNTLREEIITKDNVGENYVTSQLNFDGYNFLTVAGNRTGKYIDGVVEVTYVYETKEQVVPIDPDKTPQEDKKGQVIAHYVNINGKKIGYDITQEGNVGDSYTTKKRNFKGYTLVQIVGAYAGKYTDGTIEVTYIYIKNEEWKEPEQGTIKPTAKTTVEARKVGIGNTYGPIEIPNTGITQKDNSVIILLIISLLMSISGIYCFHKVNE